MKRSIIVSLLAIGASASILGSLSVWSAGVTSATSLQGFFDTLPYADGVANAKSPQGGSVAIDAGRRELGAAGLRIDKGLQLSGAGMTATILHYQGKAFAVGFGTRAGGLLNGANEQSTIRDLTIVSEGGGIGRDPSAKLWIADATIENVQLACKGPGIQWVDPDYNIFSPALRNIVCRSAGKCAVELRCHSASIDGLKIFNVAGSDVNEPLVKVDSDLGTITNVRLEGAWAGPLLLLKSRQMISISALYLETPSGWSTGPIVVLDGGEYSIDATTWAKPACPWKLIHGAKLYAQSVGAFNNYGVVPTTAAERATLIPQCYACDPGCAVYERGTKVAGD